MHMLKTTRNRQIAFRALIAVPFMLAASAAYAEATIVTSPSTFAISAPISTMPQAETKANLVDIRPAPRMVLKGAKNSGPITNVSPFHKLMIRPEFIIFTPILSAQA